MLGTMLGTMLGCVEEAALRTALLAAVVQLGLGVLRVKRPQLRLAAWTVVLAASLAMPGLQRATPLRLSVLPSFAGADLMEAADPWLRPALPPTPLPAAVETAGAPARAMPWLGACYLLVGGVLLLRVAVGTALSLRLLGRAAPVRAGWASGTAVRISGDVVAPVTVGSVVLLPPDAVDWPAAMRDAVLAHERAHIARWDFAMLLASQVNRAVFWFSPVSWWLHRRLAALAELASDDQAMGATGDRAGYAGVLLEMGRRPGPLLRGLPMARPATVLHRIERILSGDVRTGPVGAGRQVLLVVGAASLSVVAASSRPGSAPTAGWAPSAEQGQLPTAARLGASGPAPAGDGLPGTPPLQALPTEAASRMPAPAVAAGAPSYGPGATSAAAAGAELAARPAIRKVATLPAPRAVQRARAVGDKGGGTVPLKAEAVMRASPAARGDDLHGVTYGGLADAGVQPAPPHQASQGAGRDSPLPTQAGEPSCTGVYLPGAGGSRTSGSVDVVQAKYFQEADGTPWLKLLLGVQSRATLNGLSVERTSFRTTVLTRLVKSTSRLTGTTRGSYGSIDFECSGTNAQL